MFDDAEYVVGMCCKADRCNGCVGWRNLVAVFYRVQPETCIRSRTIFIHSCISKKHANMFIKYVWNGVWFKLVCTYLPGVDPRENFGSIFTGETHDIPPTIDSVFWNRTFNNISNHLTLLGLRFFWYPCTREGTPNAERPGSKWLHMALLLQNMGYNMTMLQLPSLFGWFWYPLVN